MRGKISKWGNSLAVRLPKALVDELGLAPGREVRLTRRGGKVTIDTAPPVRIPRYNIEDLVKDMRPENAPPMVGWDILPSEWPEEDWSDIGPSDEEAPIIGGGRGDGRRRAS